MAKPLNQYRFNRHSQNGEDGVIEEICRRLHIDQGWFVEFGAWDGKHLSNTYNLVANRGWSGVFIEGNPKKYEDLLQTQKDFPGRIHTLCAMVGYEGEDRLDRLLSRTPLPHDFELLSVDIDSYDYQVWQALVDYRPKIVIIEINSELPPGVLEIHNPPQIIRTSFSAMVQLGQDKGYTLVGHTGNCIFVQNELAASLDLGSAALERPESLFDHRKHFREKMLTGARKVLPEGALNLLFDISNKSKRLLGKK